MTEKYESDSQDFFRAMDHYGPQTQRCKGGRIVVKGYICPHCDSVDPPGKCHAPKEES